MDKDGPIHE